MGFPKLFSIKTAVNSARIKVFRRAIPDVGIVLRAEEMLMKLFLTCNSYVTDYTIKIVRLPIKGSFDIKLEKIDAIRRC